MADRSGPDDVASRRSSVARPAVVGRPPLRYDEGAVRMISSPSLPLQAALLVAVGAALGLGANVVHPRGVQLRGWAAPATCEGSAQAPPPLVSPTEAAQLCHAAGVAIADARPGSRYAEGHVAGALHLPCSARSSDAAESLSHLVGIRSLVVYGDSTAEALAVAESVRRRAPHLEVRVLDGGFSAWSQAGLACASGPCDQCEEPHGP